jgi:hypothetical protein
MIDTSSTCFRFFFVFSFSHLLISSITSSSTALFVSKPPLDHAPAHHHHHHVDIALVSAPILATTINVTVVSTTTNWSFASVSCCLVISSLPWDPALTSCRPTFRLLLALVTSITSPHHCLPSAAPFQTRPSSRTSVFGSIRRSSLAQQPSQMRTVIIIGPDDSRSF